MEVDALRVGLLSGQNPVACISKRDLVSRRAEHNADEARAPACALDLDFDHASEMARAGSATRKGDEPTWEVRRLVYAQENRVSPLWSYSVRRCKENRDQTAERAITLRYTRTTPHNPAMGKPREPSMAKGIAALAVVIVSAVAIFAMLRYWGHL